MWTVGVAKGKSFTAETAKSAEGNNLGLKEKYFNARVAKDAKKIKDTKLLPHIENNWISTFQCPHFV